MIDNYSLYSAFLIRVTASTNLPKNDQNQHFYGFSDRDKNFLENLDYRHTTLKPS